MNRLHCPAAPNSGARFKAFGGFVIAVTAAFLSACGGGGQAGTGSTEAASGNPDSRRQALAVVPAPGAAGAVIQDGGVYALRLRGTPGTFLKVAEPDLGAIAEFNRSALLTGPLPTGSEIPQSSQFLFSRLPDGPYWSPMPTGCFSMRTADVLEVPFKATSPARVPLDRVLYQEPLRLPLLGWNNPFSQVVTEPAVRVCPVASGGGVALEFSDQRRLQATDGRVGAAAPDGTPAFAANTTWDVVVVRQPGTTLRPSVRIRPVLPTPASSSEVGPRWAVDASDPDGAIAKAELFDGFNIRALAYFQPYFSEQFYPDTESHRWFVRVTDHSGASTISEPLTIAAAPLPTPPVGYAPAVPVFSVLEHPVGDLSLVAGGTLGLRAELLGNTSWLREIEWLNGNVLLARSSEYNSATYNWPGAIGTHRLTVRATDMYGKVTVSAPIQVTLLSPAAGSNMPPVVRLTAPAAVATAAEGVVQTLVAEASDPEGFLSHVEFYDGKVLLGAVSQSPYRLPWSGRVGVHAITAIAVDRGQLRTASAPLNFTVTPGSPPAAPHPNDFDATLAVVAPGINSYLPQGQPASVAADVLAVRGGSIDHVEFYVMRPEAPTDASARKLQFIGSASAAPYRITWKPEARGLYTVVARAVSKAARGTSRIKGAVITENSYNNISQGALVSTVVGPPPGAPSVTITSPAAGTAMWDGGLVLRAWAVGADGRRDMAASVKFFANGVLVGTSTAAQGHQVKWWPPTTGPGASPQVITAVSIATGRGDVTAAPVQLGFMYAGTYGAPIAPPGSVQEAPRVTLLAPLNGQRHASGSTVTLAAKVSDADGGRLKVNFVSDRGVIADVPPPYRHTIKAGGSGVDAGTRWWAEVTDDTGTTAISPTATITVVPSLVNTPPTVRLQCPATMYITAGTPYALFADARDPDGRVLQVEFFNNGQPMGKSLGEKVWTVNGIGSWIGAHRITARATDDRGATTTSAAVLLVVQPTPTAGGPVLPNPAATCSPLL